LPSLPFVYMSKVIAFFLERTTGTLGAGRLVLILTPNCLFICDNSELYFESLSYYLQALFALYGIYSSPVSVSERFPQHDQKY
jgi:hypothetical protein